MAKTRKLNTKYEPLALAVASGRTVRAAAEAVGLSESTAYHASRTEVFRKRVSELRSHAIEAAVGKLSEAVAGAVENIIALQDPKFDAAIRLNASKAILANLGPVSELGELRRRIERLEDRK